MRLRMEQDMDELVRREASRAAHEAAREAESRVRAEQPGFWQTLGKALTNPAVLATGVRAVASKCAVQ